MNPAEYLHCHQCGTRAPMVELRPGEALHCGLCNHRLMRRGRSDSFQAACAFSITGLLFLILANIHPIMIFSVAGNAQANEIITGVRVLLLQGYWFIAALVFFCAMLAPALFFGSVTYVCLSCMTRRGLPLSRPVLGILRRVQPWSLVPVFAAACVVSAVKLNLIGIVYWQPGIAWIALLAGCALALGSVFDPDAAERTLNRKEAQP